MRLNFALLLSSLTFASVASLEEREILLEFYEATGGHAWNENYGWAENLPNLCDWHGVICDESDLDHSVRKLQNGDGVVVGLRLNNNFVTGRTPSSLWELPSLLFIDISYNPHLDVSFVGLTQDTSSSPLQTVKIRDTATTNLVGLSFAAETLHTLVISENDLSSQIPADLYSLTQLTTLHVAECGLLGSVPDDIHRLSMLHELNLYKNDLTGTIPDGLSRLVHLRHLTLSYNQFHGNLPQFFDDFLNLEEFWAINNDFTGPIPSLSKSHHIRNVHLNGNSFSGDLPEDFLQGSIEGSGSPMKIDLAHNELGGELPESLDRLESLEITWTLGDNEWTDIPSSLCDNNQWNEGAVEEFSCEGLMCSPGTFNRNGYQSSDVDCQPCSSAEYWGATTCFDKDDGSVLVELFVALAGESWDQNDNWIENANFCTWYGVTCWDIGDAKDGRVRKIELPNNNLKGTIPDTIFSMHHLTTIDFSRNEIVMPFNNIGESQHVFSINVARTRTKDFDGINEANPFFKHLFADQTPISGSIPSEILQVQNLQVLSLQECGLSGELSDEIFGMGELKELHLSNNELRGNLPDRWDELGSLEVLSLAKNQFKGPLPPSLDLAVNLQAVSLQDQVTKGGGLTGTVHPYTTTSTLRTLLLGENKLEGELPEDMLSSLEGSLPITLDLSDNLLTGKIHGSWSRFKRFDLFVEKNFITEIDENLCRQYDWMSGAVGPYGCDAILCPAGTMGGRQEFTDSNCSPCSGSDVTTYLGQASCGRASENYSERDTLEVFFDQLGGVGWHARDKWMTEESVCEWYGISCDENGSVTSIQLGGNQLVGSFPTEIYQLPNLARLKLFSNTIYFSFEGIENAKNLESLSLDNTKLESLEGVGHARSLVELNVGFNNLKGAIPEEVSRLINLQSFDISHNQLSGFLPYWLQSLVSLTTFSASNNKFSGPTYDFATLRNIMYIDLSRNQLTGNIPSTLFDGVKTGDKIVADLSSNKLTGKVPGDLSRLSLLSLQVEGNQLTSVDPELCAADGWNDYGVEEFGCDGILCPAGTWNHLGRQSNQEAPCSPCKKAKYMGTTSCKSGASIRSLGLWTIGLATLSFFF